MTTEVRRSLPFGALQYIGTEFPSSKTTPAETPTRSMTREERESFVAHKRLVNDLASVNLELQYREKGTLPYYSSRMATPVEELMARRDELTLQLGLDQAPVVVKSGKLQSLTRT